MAMTMGVRSWMGPSWKRYALLWTSIKCRIPREGSKAFLPNKQRSPVSGFFIELRTIPKS